MLNPGSEELLHWLYLVALSVEAMTAALLAGRQRMDWIGVILLAGVTALGGGSTRDVLLSHHPLSWVAHPSYLLVTTTAALLTIALARFIHRLRPVFLVLDAVGLVIFTVIGCNVALSLEQPFVVVVVSGLITGCVGGVLRDILCNDVPLLFRKELYATVSIFTSAIYLAGLNLGIGHDIVAWTAMACGLTLRLLAIRYNWGMPHFVYDRDFH